jgi:putative drug exporter of the RND superfamily
MSRRSVTVRVARWSATHPWRAIGLWLLLVVVAVGAVSVIPTQKISDNDEWIGQSGRASQLIAEANLAEPPSETVLVSAKSGKLDRKAASATVGEVSREMKALSPVDSVGTPVWSEDGTAVLVPVNLKGNPDDAADNVQQLLDTTAKVQQHHPGLRVEQFGEASVDKGIWKQVGSDLARAEKLSLPITFGLMLLAFGALIAAGIPVLLALSAVAAAMGFYAPFSYLFPDAGSVANVVLLIGMAVGVDYSLFYLKREREECARGRGTVDAVEVAAATSGHSVVVSGVAVIVSMAGLYVAQDVIFSSLATGAILVVAVAVAGSLTVLPALLAKLGRWVDRPRVPLLWRVNRRIGPGGISRRILSPVLNHPKGALAFSIVVLLGLGLPALTMKIENSGAETLPRSIPEVQTYDRLQAAFPSEGSSYVVVARTSPSSLPQSTEALEELERQAVAGGKLVAVPGSEVRSSADTAVLELASPHPDGSQESKDALAELRDQLAPRTVGTVAGATWAVGGDVAESADYAQHQRDKLPWVIGFVLALTMVMMGVTFRSVLVALVTTVLNLASVAACFGVLALVFQHRWFEGVLGHTAPGFVVAWIPLFLFVVLVGLSMDYHVFVLSRVREGVRRGLSPCDAVREGVASTAGVVTSAAAVMVSVFAIFATLSMTEMKQMGIGLAVAVLIDATLIRIVMLPSILVLLGTKAWWPSKPAPVEPPAPSYQREFAEIG